MYPVLRADGARRSDLVVRKEFSPVARCVVADAVAHGTVDVRRELAPTSTRRWVAAATRGKSVATQAMYRHVLVKAGRVVHPQAYPEPVIRQRRDHDWAPDSGSLVATDAQILRLYTLSWVVSEGLGRRMRTLLDTATTVGIAPAELRALRGTDITGDADLVTVTMGDGDRRRTVPVIGSPAKAQRMREPAADVGDAPVLPGSVGNCVNRVGEDLRRAGYDDPISCRALRNWWAMRLFQLPIPGAVVLQLIGNSDIRLFYERRHLLPTYTVDELATALHAGTVEDW